MLVLVVVILGIIIAGGFLLYFLGDIVMGMSKKHSKDDEAIKQRQIEQAQKIQKRVDALGDPEKAMEDPAIATVLMNGGKVEAYDPAAEELAAQKIEEEIEAEIKEETVEEEIEEAEETPAEAPEEEFEVEEEAEEEEDEVDDVSDYIARRRKELMEKLAKIREENEAEDNSMNLDEQEAEDEEEAEETPAEEAPVEEETPVEAEEEDADPAPVQQIIVEGDLEELEERLASLQERLKANEKELRQCKKEYIPLKKVKNTLEKDEKKLRRKEALVAKQKVVLYGVNNYADIDEEKAKKLAEDLDLLDGLKLSVQHCHEVMENNKERYPLLEQVYNLLTSRNEDLKNEIQSVQEQINALKNN